MDDGIQQRGMDLLAERGIKFLDFILKTAPGFLVEQAKNGSLVLDKGLPDYLEANYNKCETIRTLLKRDSPTLLDDVYQEQRFQSDSKTRSEEDIRTSVGSSLQRTIISGGAGSGKSVFLKKLFRRSIEDGHTYYPIFFEFRLVPIGSKMSLLDYVYQSVAQYAPSFTRKQFNFGLRHGLFYLMLDAFDEAPTDFRDDLVAEIDSISKKYPKCPLVITSRPSDEFRSWEGFHVAHMLPFSLVQCRSFIGKVDYPSEKKDEFLEFVTDEKFQKHGAFLSNPLLASMMLLTFEEYGDIPERKHIFYDKCFQVLLREHDASKGRFRRSYSSGLSHEELENVFTYFCVFSYLENKFNFEHSDVEAIVASAIAASGVTTKIPDVIEDFVDAISILQRDGNHYEFTHRSFQEYFYARFAVRDRDLSLVDKVDEIRETGISDGAIRMIADMDKTYFERNFLLPQAQKLLKEVDGVDHVTSPDRLISKFWARFGIREEQIDGEQNGQTDDTAITVYYSISHDEEEYPKRKLNLILLKSMYEYDLEIERVERNVDLSNEEKLSIFDLKKMPEKRRDIELKLNHQNRRKLVALRCGDYAVELHSGLRMLEKRLEKDISAKTSKLSEIIKSKRH